MPTILALAGQDLIERFGAYAGIAAIPGLAILSLLYFAQAREVQRLRDWAGREPERDAELQERAALATRYNVAPQARPASPPARPAAAPARPATAAAAGAGVASRPATAAAGQAQRAAARAGASGEPAKVGGPAKESRDPAALPAASTPAAQGAAGARAGANEPVEREPAAAGPTALRERGAPNGPPSDAPDGAGAAAPVVQRPGSGAGPPGGQRPGSGAGPPRPGVARPGMRQGSGPPAPRPTSPPGPSTSLRRPGARLPDRAALYGPRQTDSEPERSSGTRWLLALGGVGALALLVAIVVAVFQLGSGGDETAKPVNTVQGEPAQSQGANKPDAKAKRRKPKALVRSEVTVVVLNGTTVPGLAATIADKVEQAGFARGKEADNSDQQVPASMILYGPGQKRAGQEVAKVLDVSEVRPLDAGTQAIAGADASVVVVVGVDKTT